MAKGSCAVADCDAPATSREWCPRHYARWKRWGDPLAGALPKNLGLAARFWPRVDKNGPNGCWIWTGTRAKTGYGTIGADRTGWTLLAHRVAYEFVIGPIPEGLTLDHLCRVRLCVNPAHLEPVTLAENKRRGESLPAKNARKTQCESGHPYTPQNTYIHPVKGWRRCRTCDRAIEERRRARRKR